MEELLATLTDNLSAFSLGALPSADEIKVAFFELNAGDRTVLGLLALWGLILSLPLTGIDRRDRIAAGTYGAFIVTTLALLLAVTPDPTGRFAPPTPTILAIFGFTAALARWRGRPRKVELQIIEVRNETPKKKNREDS